MRRYPILTAVMIGSAVLAGCSSGSQPASSSTSSSAPASSAAPPSSFATHDAAPGAVDKSPAGVTTAVGAPAESTEDEYFQACHAATTWMAGKGGNVKEQFEPYLADLQKSDQPTPGTFGTPWSKLTPARQAAVIVAADAASNGLCG